VRAHLKQPSLGLSDWIEAVLAEDTQPDDVEKPVQTQTRAQLSMMMTDDDWERLAEVAAAAAADSISNRASVSTTGPEALSWAISCSSWTITLESMLYFIDPLYDNSKRGKSGGGINLASWS